MGSQALSPLTPLLPQPLCSPALEREPGSCCQDRARARAEHQRRRGQGRWKGPGCDQGLVEGAQGLCRALTVQGGNDCFPQGQDQPQRAPEEEEVGDLKVKPAQGCGTIQHRGAARAAGAGLIPQHAGMEAVGGRQRSPRPFLTLWGTGQG